MTDEVIAFPLKKEISGPITMDAEAFKANLAAAYSAGAMMMRERAAKACDEAAEVEFDDGFEANGARECAATIRKLEIPC